VALVEGRAKQKAMTREWLEGASLVAPLLGGALLHGLCIRFKLAGWLARPLDGGAQLRGRRLFGDNKTWRGVLLVAIGTALLFPLWARAPELARFTLLERASLGAGVGFCAMLAELPNSFLKRQLDIRPGTQASGARGAIFHVLDQVDLGLGAWLMLAPFVGVTWMRVVGSFVFLYATHQMVTLAGYWLGMRATAR
jgi:CDP-archaeol synthase